MNRSINYLIILKSQNLTVNRNLVARRKINNIPSPECINDMTVTENETIFFKSKKRSSNLLKKTTYGFVVCDLVHGNER